MKLNFFTLFSVLSGISTSTFYGIYGREKIDVNVIEDKDIKEEKEMNGEFVLFNSKGERLCGSGKEGTTSGMGHTDCSRNGMKTYPKKNGEVSKLGLRSKEKNSLFDGADPFLVKLGGRKVTGKIGDKPNCKVVKEGNGKEGSCIPK